MLCIAAGGWLLATHLFDLESRERVLVGLAVGLVSYCWVVNWIGRFLLPAWAFVGAAVVVLAVGSASAYPFRRPWLKASDWRIGGWLTSGLVLFWIFLRISKGTGLFDEYKNLALISTLGNGWIPALAHFGDPELLRYHYGFHLIGAGMMQLGHFMPWSAFDLSKSIVWSLSLLLTALVGRRHLGSQGAALLLAGAVALSGGTRYLLLLLPSGVLAGIQEHIKLTGIASGALIPAMRSILPMETSPQIGYPFAFLSGIDPSYIMAHGGEQTIEPLLFMLALLLIGRSAKKASALFFAVLFSYWALASETSLGLFAMAWILMLGWRAARERRFPEPKVFLAPSLGLLAAVPMMVLQGGTLSAMAQQLTTQAATAVSAAGGGAAPAGFSLRWPPAIVSGQLGQMPLADPLALAAGIFEMGIVVILLPWLTVVWWRQARRDWIAELLLLVAWSGVLVPLFVTWDSPADISHITDFGIDTTVVLLVFMLMRGEHQAAKRRFDMRAIGFVVLILTCIPGVVLLGVQLTAAQDTVLSEHYGDAEARLVSNAWGKLPQSAKVLGSVGTASTLTGQLTAGIYTLPGGNERPIWEAMLTEPRLAVLRNHGFDFAFVDSRWWSGLDAQSRAELEAPCVDVFARGEEPANGHFAEILDLRGCPQH